MRTVDSLPRRPYGAARTAAGVLALVAAAVVAALLLGVLPGVLPSGADAAADDATDAAPTVVAGVEDLPHLDADAVAAGVGAQDDSPLSWAPAARTVDGLRVLATAGPDGFAVHTRGGDRTFLPGVNLGSTTPGHQPGELAITAADYRRWFDAMGRLGVRVVRIYTIHPPAFYAALAEHNAAHPTAPLYLLHGVYLPDETRVAAGELLGAATTTAMTAEVRDAVAAVHGDLTRAPQRGRASGTWTVDVGEWLVGWVVGVEWDPDGTDRADRAATGAPPHRGTWFSATEGATPTESWLAARLDELAAAEAARGVSVPVALVNWPTTDPLEHPEEPLEAEDLVSVDANHVLPTERWPGGTFASYHAYPYYPDFLRHEPGLQQPGPDGRVDAYRAYLAALRDHHAPHMPTMITELGVPSSVGSAHDGTLGRDQGGHAETEATATDAALVETVADLGMAGAVVFAWSDEWFKATWNTMNHQVAERRQLWHDALTNEQHFGLLATDAEGRQDDVALGGGVTAAVDEAYVHLRVPLPAGAERVVVGVDALDEASGEPVPGSADRRADTAVVIDLDHDLTADGADGADGGTGAQVHVRRELDPAALDLAPAVLDAELERREAGSSGAPWRPFRLVTNRRLGIPTTGKWLPVEMQETGALLRGDWEPGVTGSDSRALWRVTAGTLELRLPWGMAGVADPSSRTVLDPRPGAQRYRVVESLGITLTVDGDPVAAAPLTWEPWTAVRAGERLKDGAGVLRTAMLDTAERRAA